MADQEPESMQHKSHWQSLWRRPQNKLLLGIPVGGYLLFLIGVGFWTGSNSALDYSNTEAFCISCHVMKDNVYAEYQETIHYSNRTGHWEPSIRARNFRQGASISPSAFGQI
jgi:cytochrome c-type protein NapC